MSGPAPSSPHRYFASCAKSLEPLLADEIRQAGATELRETAAGVFFTGTLKTAYRVCVFSRLANRVIRILAQGPVTDSEALYAEAQGIDWLRQLDPGQTLAVRASGTSARLKHTRFTAQRIKDAIVDQFTAGGSPRPDVSREAPDLLIHAVLKKGQLTLGIDLVGESLHRRHYRQEQGGAPLKETLAAALLIRAGWPRLMHGERPMLRDPLCGSGTLLIEGMLMALDIAPGLLRERQLSGWRHHDREAMEQILEEARHRRRRGADWPGGALGSDLDHRVVQKARRNAERAGVYDWLEFRCSNLDEASREADEERPSLVICNPPYAERLGEEPETMQLYQALGRYLQQQAEGTEAAVFTAKPQWGRLLGLHSHKQYAFYNGKLPASLLCFRIGPDTIYRKRRDPSSEAGAGAENGEEAVLDAGARMLANRLRKNLRNIGRWARKNGHECYRLYDADMPEYAFAIDLYGKRVHMQEYRAPATISEADATLRRRQAVQAVISVLAVPAHHVSLKMRQRQRGGEQYEATAQRGEFFTVQEGPAQLRVNLQRYLDTGLFPDHRPIRRYIRENAAGKRFLNLFCYTGAATVHAALGGARQSVSVDLSNTYLDWAAKNLELNGIDTGQHQMLRMDCMKFLERCREQFDLIFLDPPTFSNSKSTEQTLDIQRDHADLIRQCMTLLSRNGLLIFSTNKRRFRLDDSLRERFTIEDHSARSIDRDFARSPEIHSTWLIRES